METSWHEWFTWKHHVIFRLVLTQVDEFITEQWFDELELWLGREMIAGLSAICQELAISLTLDRVCSSLRRNSLSISLSLSPSLSTRHVELSRKLCRFRQYYDDVCNDTDRTIAWSRYVKLIILLSAWFSWVCNNVVPRCICIALELRCFCRYDVSW